MRYLEYCENCGNFVEINFKRTSPVSYCPACNCDMRGEENENDHSYEERIEDGFNTVNENFDWEE